MTGRRFRRVGLGLAAVLVALGSAAPADAVTLGKSHGYIYIATSKPVPPQDSAGVAAKCPKGTTPVSGGPEISEVEDHAATYLSSSYPAGRSWKVEGWYTGTGVPTLTAYAICTKNTQNVVVAKEPGTTTTDLSPDTLACPKGSATGGGFRGTGDRTEWWLTSLAPIDDIDDADEVPSDGWLSEVHKTTAAELDYTGYAVCLKKEDVHYFSGGAEAGVPLIMTSAQCLNGETLVGGGFNVSGLPSTTHLVGVRATDSADIGEVPDDGWAGTLSNPGLASRAIVTTAICL